MFGDKMKPKLNDLQESIKNERKMRKPHKESMAKPLNDSEDDDISPNSRNRKNPFYKDGYQSEVSRFIDEKRSTIKEQMEEEEEFTGSSMNMSTKFGGLKVQASSQPKKKCKKKKSSKIMNPKVDRSNTSEFQRKHSVEDSNTDVKDPQMTIQKNYRKFTENIGERMFQSNRNEMSTTLGGTSGVSPLVKTLRKESDYDGYAASVSMGSTPTMINKVIRINKADSPVKRETFTSEISLQKPFEQVIQEQKHEESRKGSKEGEEI